jgi:hypothetical protein
MVSIIIFDLYVIGIKVYSGSRPIRIVKPAEHELMVWGVFNNKRATKCRVGIAKLHEPEEPLNNRLFDFNCDFIQCVVVTVDITAVLSGKNLLFHSAGILTPCKATGCENCVLVDKICGM